MDILIIKNTKNNNIYATQELDVIVILLSVDEIISKVSL